MSMIVTGMEMPKFCGECNASGTGVCRKWVSVKELGSKRSELCPLKSVDGLIEKLNECADNKSTGEQVGIDLAIDVIKEYCGMEDAE